MSDKKKRILITGGAGFIGRKLADRLLSRGDQVRILDNLSPQIHDQIPQDMDWLRDKGIEFFRGTVTDRGDWESCLKDVNYVVHLAAETGTGQSMYKVAHYNRVNDQGTAIMLDVMAAGGAKDVERIVLASSRSVYGEGRYSCGSCGLSPIYPAARPSAQLKAHLWEHKCPSCNTSLIVEPTRETDLERPASIYAATKLAQEHLVRVGAEALGVGYVNLRFQNVYGEGQSLKNPYTGILSIFSTRIRRGLTLPLFEDGEESRDFVHVDDVVTAIAAALDVKEALNGVFNVGSGYATSVAEIARELTRAFNEEPRLSVTGQYRLGDIRHNVADVTLLREKLGVTARIDLRTGLRRFADWVSSQPLPQDLLDKANRELAERALMGS